MSQPGDNNGTNGPPNQGATEPNNGGGSEQSILDKLGITMLPLVATLVTLFQLLLFIVSTYFEISVDKISVSWDSVISNGGYWRLFVAHYFHSSAGSLFVNCVSLMTMGRYLESKINAPSMFFLINIMGIMSNGFYIILSKLLCNDPSHFATIGLAHVIFGERVLLAYTEEPRNYQVTLFLGLYPLYLPVQWAPWQPVLETILFKLIMPELIIIGHLAGILTGFLVSFSLLMFPDSLIHKGPVNFTDSEAGSNNNSPNNRPT